MTAAMSFLSRAFVISFLLINNCQNGLFYNIKRSTPDVARNETETHIFYDTDEVKMLDERFRELDLDNSSTLSIDELKPSLRHPGFLAQRAFSIFDADGNGQVDSTEFKQAGSQYYKSNVGSVLGIEFRILDTDNDGFIRNSELFHIFMMTHGNDTKDTELKRGAGAFIQIGDKDGDGNLSWDEYYLMMMKLWRATKGPVPTVDNIEHVDADEIRTLGEKFHELDLDNSSTLSIEELKRLDTLLTQNQQSAQRVFQLFDADSNGQVDSTEYTKGVEGGMSRLTFRFYDMNNDGFISNSEFFQTHKMINDGNLNNTSLRREVDSTIMVGDRDGDGKLGFEEYRLYVKDVYGSGIKNLQS